jgi:hypothetical protein
VTFSTPPPTLNRDPENTSRKIDFSTPEPEKDARAVVSGGLELTASAAPLAENSEPDAMKGLTRAYVLPCASGPLAKVAGPNGVAGPR